MTVRKVKRRLWKSCLVSGIFLLSFDPAAASQCQLNNAFEWRDQFVEVAGDFTGDGNEDLFLVGEQDPSSPLGGRRSWLCTGPNLFCNIHNTDGWSRYDVVAGNFNGDAYDDLFLVGNRRSLVCLGPDLNCSTNNNFGWKPLFEVTSGDFTGDGYDDLFLIGKAGVSSPLAAPNSWLCTGPNLYCNVHNTDDWSQFDAVAGDYDGDGYDDLFLMGTPDSFFCPGPALSCSLNNSSNWKLLYEGASAHLNDDGYEDLFLIGAPTSWVCLGPALYCNVDNENYWKTKFDVVFGDFDGNKRSSAYLSGDPYSHVCSMPSVPCQESALQPVVCESDVSSLVPITVTTAMDTIVTNATFQSHSQRVVHNSHGIFLAANAAHGHWKLRRSTDGGVSFTTAVEKFNDTNPPALETDRAGNVYAFYAQQHGQNNAIYEKFEPSTAFATPTFTTVIPVESVSKYATYFDDLREQIYFMNFNNFSDNFYTLSPVDGSICADAFCPQQLTIPGPEASIQYPHLQMDGYTLFVAWTSSPNDFQTGSLVSYRSIQVMKSEDGGRDWLTIDNMPLTTPVVADETGPTRQIVEACDFDNRTWLSSFAPAGGDLHFLYLARRGDGLQHYVSIDEASAVEEQRTAPVNGSKVSFKSLDGFFVVDGPVLYMVGEGCDRIVVFASQDNGVTWQDYAASAPFPAGYGAYGISGFREVTADGFIVGAYTEFDSTPGSTNHRVMFFKVPAL